MRYEAACSESLSARSGGGNLGGVHTHCSFLVVEKMFLKKKRGTNFALFAHSFT